MFIVSLVHTQEDVVNRGMLVTKERRLVPIQLQVRTLLGSQMAAFSWHSHSAFPWWVLDERGEPD